jgi:hypothetical protein
LYIPWHFPLHKDSTIQGASKTAEQAFQKQYPAVYNHLLKYKKELSNRNQAETGIRYEWYALQRWGANYCQDLLKPKLAWTSIGETYYSFIPKDIFLLDTTYFLATTENIFYLLSILNSKLITFWINSEDTQIGHKNAYRHYKCNIEKLHVPKPTPATEKKILKLLEAKNYSAIDELVYSLYNLSKEEISFINSSS